MSDALSKQAASASHETAAGPTEVAVIGVGRMGRHHARVYSHLPGVKLVAVVDSSADRAGTVADDFDCDALSSSEELLAKYPGVKAVSIAVPTVAHVTEASPLLERGVACLVEKPLAGSADEARKLTELAARHNAALQVGHTERFNPAVLAVSSLDIQARFMEVDRVSPMTFRSLDVGVVMDMMIHDIDIVLMLARSKVVRVDAVGVAVMGEREDVCNARLEFANGCIANLTASRLALKTERKLRVFSEDAYVSLDYARRSGVVIHRKDNDEALQRLRSQIAAGSDLSNVDYSDLVSVRELTMEDQAAEQDPLTAELSSFLDAVRQGRRPAVDGEAGLAAVDVATRITQAVARHKWEGLGEKIF